MYLVLVLFKLYLQRHLCALLFLTPRLPGFWIGRRLNSHTFELMQLDRAIVRLGLHQLNDAELREVRGHSLFCLVHSVSSLYLVIFEEYFYFTSARHVT